MGTSLTPIDTSIGKKTTQGTSCVDVDAEFLKGTRASGSEITLVAGDFGIRCEIEAGFKGKPSKFVEAIMECDSKGARDVVVARARGTKMRGRVGYKGPARSASEHAQGLEGGRYMGTF